MCGARNIFSPKISAFPFWDKSIWLGHFATEGSCYWSVHELKPACSELIHFFFNSLFLCGKSTQVGNQFDDFCHGFVLVLCP